MLKTTLIILGLYSFSSLWLFIKQRDMMYFPTPEAHASQAGVVWLENQQHKLKIWQINSGDPAIIYFGGNAEGVENNIPLFSQIFSGRTVYLVNYRGYGGSSGEPTEQALFDDALVVYDYVKKQHKNISIIGRSLGSGVASYVASQRDVEKLALITPYDSIKNVAQSHYPIFPVKWLLKDAFDSLSRATEISSPTLIMMAEFDQVIPRKHSEKLAASMQHLDLQTHVLAATNHNDIGASRDFAKHLQSFLNPMTE